MKACLRVFFFAVLNPPNNLESDDLFGDGFVGGRVGADSVLVKEVGLLWFEATFAFGFLFTGCWFSDSTDCLRLRGESHCLVSVSCTIASRSSVCIDRLLRALSGSRWLSSSEGG